MLIIFTLNVAECWINEVFVHMKKFQYVEV